MITIDLNSYLLSYIGFNQPDSELEKRTSTAFERGAIFSKEGGLSERTYELSKEMNSKLALFNCPVMALQTAHLLEKGSIPELPLKCLYIPRPKNIIQLMNEDWSKGLFTNLPPNRGFMYMNCSKKTLDRVMLDLGKGTHAMVSGRFKYLYKLGHMWNYLVNEDEHGNRKLVVLDSYSAHHHQRGIEDPDQYFTSYDEDDLWVTIFYETTPENIELAMLNQVL